MAIQGTIITKAGIINDVNNDIVTPKNSRVVWWTGSSIEPNCGTLDTQLTPMGESNLSSTLTANEVITQIRNFAKESTRIRQLESGRFNPSCGNYSVYNGIRVAALTSAYYVSALTSQIDTTPGPQGVVSATALNNFVTTLKNIADLSEGAAYRVACITQDGCHCSCHSSCHASCHSSCHSSRARR
jgi:hypothetical protein